MKKRSLWRKKITRVKIDMATSGMVKCNSMSIKDETMESTITFMEVKEGDNSIMSEV